MIDPLLYFLLNFAQVMFAIAAYPNIYRVMKDRNRLKGFSIWGTLFTSIGYPMTMLYVYYTNGLWYVTVPNLIFWWSACGFNIRLWWKNGKHLR